MLQGLVEACPNPRLRQRAASTELLKAGDEMTDVDGMATGLENDADATATMARLRAKYGGGNAGGGVSMMSSELGLAGGGSMPEGAPQWSASLPGFGSGKTTDYMVTPCSACGGSGTFQEEYNNRVLSRHCEKCDGEGTISSGRNVLTPARRTGGQVTRDEMERGLPAICAACGDQDQLLACPCLKVQYCSAKCQKEDWGIHKPRCEHRKKLKAAKAAAKRAAKEEEGGEEDLNA